VYSAEDAKFLLDAICDGVDVGRPVAAESLESPNWQMWLLVESLGVVESLLLRFL
jgi:hypothetical protein